MIKSLNLLTLLNPLDLHDQVSQNKTINKNTTLICHSSNVQLYKVYFFAAAFLGFAALGFFAFGDLAFLGFATLAFFGDLGLAAFAFLGLAALGFAAFLGEPAFLTFLALGFLGDPAFFGLAAFFAFLALGFFSLTFFSPIRKLPLAPVPLDCLRVPFFSSQLVVLQQVLEDCLS